MEIAQCRVAPAKAHIAKHLVSTCQKDNDRFPASDS
jgi:hypothetical protein